MHSECPVAECSVCDTSVTLCDLCSGEGAAFDSQSQQCVVGNTRINDDTDFDFYLGEGYC